ncbi:acyltransferase family protein [Stakelama sediminis]|uniref:Acyltransferase 3 domain-containing protein n=1 Tax=Stakelama sediminis TaxID=463200 RepID=A0A840YV94_9SPHN|nr:acyltransferase [Stakelama sediminis]MBB5717465.1 hypothetical protein [Stakelama sediminis]
MTTQKPASMRHYGMDWLRVGAFALLILYHIAMVFIPWNYHVKSTHIVHWAVLPMLAINAWRLSLLFVVSGYASRALLRRTGNPGEFARNRSLRLLIPLAFGIIVVVPVQPWVELVTKYGFTHSFAWFWLHDFFSFRTIDGLFLPNWNHLWFVGYLWVYTMVLIAGAALIRSNRVQQFFDRLFGGIGVLLIPMAWLLMVHTWWFPMVGETHMLFDDGIAHAAYFPAFLFGFALGGSETVMRAIGRWWTVAAVLAMLGYATILAIELHWTDNFLQGGTRITVYAGAHAVQQGSAVIALIGIADRFWNHNYPIRATLTEAVFPFYIIHQTIIVFGMYLLLPAGLPGWAQFAILLVATVAGCWLFYRVGRAIVPLRPLVGLRLHKPQRKESSLAVV